MPVARLAMSAAILVTLALVTTRDARADVIEPFVQVEVDGEVHRIIAWADTAFCSALNCVAGVIELPLESGSVRVVGVMRQGVDPRAPEYGHNNGQWSVRLYVEATNLSPDPMTVTAWAGTPVSPLFLFLGCCALVEAHDATYHSSLLRTLTTGGPDPDTVSVHPVFPDLDGDGDPEILNALATSTPGGAFHDLGIDRGTAVTGKGFANAYDEPTDLVHIDPDWVFLSTAVAFNLSGNGDSVSMRGDVLILPSAVPEPATLGLVGLGLAATAIWRRNQHRIGN